MSGLSDSQAGTDGWLLAVRCKVLILSDKEKDFAGTRIMAATRGTAWATDLRTGTGRV